MGVESAPLDEYARLLTKLVSLRAVGLVPDDVEAEIAEALNDCRSRMTEAEQDQIGEIVERLRGL